MPLPIRGQSGLSVRYGMPGAAGPVKRWVRGEDLSLMAEQQKPDAQLIHSLRRLGTHDPVCLIYQDLNEKRDTVIPFLQIGLERGEQCIYLTEEVPPDTFFADLPGSDKDFGRCLENQPVIIRRIDSFLRPGEGAGPGADALLRHVTGVYTQAVESAKSQGFSSVRFALEMTWILNPDYGVTRLRETIAYLQHFLATHDALCLSLYHRTRFDPEIILDVIYTHPIVITNGWVCRNFYLIPPRDFVAPDPVSREVDRVLKNLCDHQRILENLLKSEEKYRLLLERQTDLVCGFNPDGTLTAGPAVLLPAEYSSKLVAAEPDFTAALPDGAGLVVLDATVTPELEAEGWAKDRIRELQDLRKSTGLEVSDRIRVVMSVPADKQQWAATHRDLIAGEILATSFEFGEPADGAEIGDGVRVSIAKAGTA